MDKSERSYTVYAQVFPDGKAYIGTTSQPLCKRWRNGKGYPISQGAIHNAIQSTGWMNIEKRVIATELSESDAYAQEQELIRQYGTHVSQNGYNSSTGGKSGAKGSIRSDEWKADLSKRIRGVNHPLYGKHHTKETRDKLSKAQRNHPVTEQMRLGRINAGRKTRKAVVCLESGALYSSQTEAARVYGISSSSISIACSKFPARTAGGLHWQYADRISTTILTSKDQPPVQRAPKSVQCLETGKMYDSIHAAAADTGFDIRHISRCCREQGRTTKGMHWRYYDIDSTDNR